MKKLFFILSVALLTLTACSSDSNDSKFEDQKEQLTKEKLYGIWATDYPKSGNEDGMIWDRVIKVYLFRGDGTGYYECYGLYGNEFVGAEMVRGDGDFHFTISGNTATMIDDATGEEWSIVYEDGKFTDPELFVFQKATTEQQRLIEQLYGDFQASNSGSESNGDSKIENVDGNIDITNGGGGVTDVR
jgi:hypothetical protein